MRRVELRLRGGEHVAFVEILPYQVGPDVVIWGERVFVSQFPLNAHPEGVFFEASSLVSFTPSPGLPPAE